MILDLLSLLDRRVLGGLILTVSVVGAALAVVRQDAGAAAAAAPALLVPAAALGAVAIVVEPVRLIVTSLAVGAVLMVGGLLVGFAL